MLNVVQGKTKALKYAPGGEQKKEKIIWSPTPLTDASKLTNQYLMLSKIRLTSEFSYMFHTKWHDD